MSLMNSTVGTTDFDNMVIKAGAAGHIRLAAGQGVIEKGSVIDADGLLYDGTEPEEPAEGEEEKTAAVPRFILCDETDTGDSASGADVTAAVWKTGTFIRGSLIVAEGYTFTDADAEALRDYGIIVEDAQ